MCSADIFLGLLAILFPPLPVWVKCGICSADSLINILLLILGYIPGLLHAWYIIAKYPEPSWEYESLAQDAEGGRVTYVFVHGRGDAPNPNPSSNTTAPQQHPGMTYGTTGGASAASANPAGPSAPVAPQGAGEGSSDPQAPPPSYATAVAGDNKVQSQD